MGKHNRLFLIPISLFVFLLFSSSLVSAAPPVQTNLNINYGYQVEYPKIDIIKQNTPFIFNFHAYNLSSGLAITNTLASCTFHIYNSVGDHILINNSLAYVADDKEWEILVPADNFTKAGEYSYIVQCNSSNLGGFASVPFIVSSDGTSDNINYYVFLFIIAYGILILGISTRNTTGTILGGFATMALGIICINTGINGIKNNLTMIVSVMTIAVGAFWAAKAGLEQLEVF